MIVTLILLLFPLLLLLLLSSYNKHPLPSCMCSPINICRNHPGISIASLASHHQHQHVCQQEEQTSSRAGNQTRRPLMSRLALLLHHGAPAAGIPSKDRTDLSLTSNVPYPPHHHNQSSVEFDYKTGFFE